MPINAWIRSGGVSSPYLQRERVVKGACTGYRSIADTTARGFTTSLAGLHFDVTEDEWRQANGRKDQ